MSKRRWALRCVKCNKQQVFVGKDVKGIIAAIDAAEWNQWDVHSGVCPECQSEAVVRWLGSLNGERITND